VDGRRITNSEYTYFLKMQQNIVETNEGLTGKTDEERKAFWAQDAVEGENPILSVKKSALDNAREYAIQIQQAKDLGLVVDDSIRTSVQSYIDNIRQSQGEEAYTASLNDIGLTEALYKEILQNYYLIDAFKSRYMADNYKQAEISEDTVKAAYEKDTKQYDTVTARILYLKKSKEDGTTLDDTALAAQKKKAEEILAKIKAGGDMEALTKENSETSTAKEDGGINSLTYAMQPYEPEVIDWAFAAKQDDVALLDTSYGYFVIRMEGRTGLDEAKEAIRTDMVNTAMADFYNAAIDDWMKDAKYNVVLKNKVFEKFTVQ